MPILGGIAGKGAFVYIDFQSCPLHINICSPSKDNNTQGTKSCPNGEEKRLKTRTAWQPE